MRRKVKTTAQLEAQAAAWNQQHAVGTLVDYAEILGDPPDLRAKTRSEAEVLSGHTVVVWLEGKSGCVCIEHCEPVADEVSA